MAGGEQTADNNPKGFNECVSQEQLQAVVEDAQKRMNEAVRKAVTDALIELNIGNSMERLDKRISTLTTRLLSWKPLWRATMTSPAATPMVKTRCMMPTGT